MYKSKLSLDHACTNDKNPPLSSEKHQPQGVYGNSHSAVNSRAADGQERQQLQFRSESRHEHSRMKRQKQLFRELYYPKSTGKESRLDRDTSPENGHPRVVWLNSSIEKVCVDLIEMARSVAR